MGVSKVDFAGNTLVDLTGDSVTPATLKKGETAHNAAGEPIVGTMEAGGGTTPGVPGDITFYDYDGTIVTSWTLAELATKTALPDYPSHDGLICQGWNWSLADLKTTNRKMNVGAMYITDDGKTRIYIRLEEGRTSPMLGICPNGTVTVDWGDGTTPDTLTGTSTSTVQWTPNHAYAAPGEYVIKLTVDGAMGFSGSVSPGNNSRLLRYSSSTDARNYLYLNAISKIELGQSITEIGGQAFFGCASLQSVSIPASITSIGNNVAVDCCALKFLTIPDGVEEIADGAFSGCRTLTTISIPNSAWYFGDKTFNGCYAMKTLTLPNHGNKEYFMLCSRLLMDCRALSEFVIPNDTYDGLDTHVFNGCSGMKYYDFSQWTSVPTLYNANTFTGIPGDCEIRVPASLVDAWKAATNWATYADHIVGV